MHYLNVEGRISGIENSVSIWELNSNRCDGDGGRRRLAISYF